MSLRAGRSLNVVGAGLAGALLAVLLARRGWRVRVFDRRPDPRRAPPDADRGRSINLALAARGLRALERAGLRERLAPILIEMRGRMIHVPGERPSLQRYGQRPHEVIWSVARGGLNRALIEAAADLPGVELRFGQACTGVRLAQNTLLLRDGASGHGYEVALGPTIAADGAGSAVRQGLAATGMLEAREDWLDHDYRELGLPATHAGGLERHALHIWPRGEFMLIALPNPDGSFTATLFLPRSGPVSFDSLQSPEDVRAFFAREFPDAIPLMPDHVAEFTGNPRGALGTLHCAPWHVGGQVLLLGDAAHAIVPFHGQGMNCAFEDCVEIAELLGDAGDDVDVASAFAEFERRRRPNAAAIAKMALENYREMRATVLEPAYLARKALGEALERRLPGRFVPRYSMVSFHPEIPYAEALRRGEIQAELLRELLPGVGERSAEEVLDEAVRLAEARLTPLAGSAAGTPTIAGSA